MKRITALSVAALAILACTGALAVSSASAAETSLCKSNESPTSCAEANRYPSGTEISATSTKATIETNLGNVKCSSSYHATSTAQSGEPLPLGSGELTLSGCALGETKCTATGSYPTSWSLYGGEGGNGSLITTSSGSWAIKCGSTINCTLSAPGNFTVEGGNPAHLSSNQPMSPGEGTFCPKTATFSSSYTVNSPQPLYVPAKTETTLCTNNTYGSLCPKGSRYASGTRLTAVLPKGTTAHLETSIGTYNCSKSVLEGTTSAQSGNPLGASISSMTLQECVLGATACEVSFLGLPYSASFQYGAASSLKAKGVEFQLKCGPSTCTIKFFEAHYTVHNTSATAPATLTINQEAEHVGAFCPSAIVFNAEYEITAPTPLYVAHT